MDLTHFLLAIAGIAMPVVILLVIFNYENRKEQRFHDTVQKMIDNGQEFNEELLSSIPGYKKNTSKNDMGSAINTVGVGIGLILLGLFALGSVISGIGLLVASIGAAMLINAKLNPPKDDQ